MARQKISEYRAKRLLLGDTYQGMTITGTSELLPKSGRYVVKVDQGIKRRFKQGLVGLDKTPSEISNLLKKWRAKGYEQFLVEPYLVHKPSEERYLSLERVREGVRLLFAPEGGIEIESHPEDVQTHLLTTADDVIRAAQATTLPLEFLRHLLEVFEKTYFAFLEINPLVVRGKEVCLLDAAALVDSAGAFFVRSGWSEEDIVSRKTKYQAEERIQRLSKTTPASLKLTVLNPNGSLFFLLSGGGGSIVIADQAQMQEVGGLIGNYGEYSGGPTREETHLYAREVISLLLKSQAKKKALIIAGGVANFTDVRSTFAGIVDALKEETRRLRKMGVRVFIRRGGPHEKEGLQEMKTFLEQTGLLGSVHGSEAPLTQAVDDAIAFLHHS